MAVGIWKCGTKNCRIKVAGGAWNYTTTAAASVRSAVRRLKEVKELYAVRFSLLLSMSSP